MSIRRKKDVPIKNTLTSNAKALRINLNKDIYGTFAEIGAGQETVRYFFRSGGASGTIAKAMSAYDKDFSTAIYGIGKDQRYVTEDRLKRMLKYEIGLIETRLNRKKHPKKIYFCYANTVCIIDFAKKFKGHGWVGIRFQLNPDETYNEIILHFRFKETDSTLQQKTLGKLGINLIYGAFYHNDDPKKLIKSLYDNLKIDQIEIDVANFSGTCFANVDNRLMSLFLVKNGMTNAVMFNSEEKNLLPADELYKKNILILRGRFRPVTKVGMDLLEQSQKIFFNKKNVKVSETKAIFEITLSNLKNQGKIDEIDFLDRAELLCSLGHMVMITDYSEYYKLAEYFNEFCSEEIRFAMGADNIIDIFNIKYYKNLNGGILEGLGKLFTKNIKIYLHPILDKDNMTILDSNNLKIHPKVKELYKYFKSENKIIDITKYNIEHMKIASAEMFDKISKNEREWEKLIPEGIVEIIKLKKLFGYKKD